MINPKDRKDDCYKCAHKRDVLGNCHIRCANPDETMQGNPHGMKHGWFYYPMLFDPIWRETECKNFEQVSSVSGAVSQVA